MLDLVGALEIETNSLGVIEKSRVLVDNEDHTLFIASARDILNQHATYASYLFYKIQEDPTTTRYLVTYVTRDQLSKLEDGLVSVSSLLRPKNFVAFIVDLDAENEETTLKVSVVCLDALPGCIFPDEDELDFN